ncbi:MAG: substrate-binding domain-containing protein, partial [Acidobacteriota bacterium]
DKETWYVSAGQGMMTTLNMAGERKGYTLVDRGTYIAYEDQAKGKPALVILVEGDKPLLNQYSVIPVNPAKCPKVKAKEAQQFSDWLASAKGQKVVGDFTLKGKKLFTPNAGK